MKQTKVKALQWDVKKQDDVRIVVFDGYSFDHEHRDWHVYAVKCPWGYMRWYTYLIDPFTGVAIDCGETVASDEKGACEVVVKNIQRGYGGYKFKWFYKLVKDDPDTYNTTIELFNKAVELCGQ